MSDRSRNLDFWVCVLNTAERLDGRPEVGDRTSVSEQLLTLEEAFDRRFDPADDFKEYVLLQLCRSIRRRLD